MATLTLLLLISSVLSLTPFTAAAATTSTTNFIRTKCSSTAYPKVCVQSLSSFATKIHKSPRQLAQTSLIVSLAKARYTKTYVAHLAHSNGLRPREFGPVKDCLEVIGDTVDRLSRSAHEFQTAVRAQSRDFLWHMNNVQTWASAALTDENTCVDGFEGPGPDGRMQNEMKAQLESVMQYTSNALALVNQFAKKHSSNHIGS